MSGARQTLRPYGLRDLTSSAEHEHLISSNTVHLSTSSGSNAVSYIDVGLLRSKVFGTFNIPVGAIIGYEGMAIPEGWERVDKDGEGREIAGFALRVSKSGAFKATYVPPHDHDLPQHEHNFTVHMTDPDSGRNRQVFQSWNSGTESANLAHGHLVKSQRSEPASVGASAIGLPTVELVLIRSKSEQSHFPIGAVVPTFSKNAPPGWELVIPPQSDWKTDIYYLTSGAKGTGIRWKDRPSAHGHSVKHAHLIQVIPDQSKPGGLLKAGQGNLVAPHDHDHEFRIQVEGSLEPVDARPVTLGLNFIRRKR